MSLRALCPHANRKLGLKKSGQTLEALRPFCEKNHNPQKNAPPPPKNKTPHPHPPTRGQAAEARCSELQFFATQEVKVQANMGKARSPTSNIKQASEPNQSSAVGPRQSQEGIFVQRGGEKEEEQVDQFGRTDAGLLTYRPRVNGAKEESIREDEETREFGKGRPRGGLTPWGNRK